ncbi:MAG: rRNA maturation RNase YbeY [Deltaproteobacteria bacterium]|nr:rRNA maturation RNase YbeY [Deltaproteobacteria bacterium]
MNISLSNRQKKLSIKSVRVKAKAKAILNALGYPEGELSLVLVDDAAIAVLNQQYLNREGATNVISFPMQEGPHGQVNPNLLGDVVISVETAMRQAESGGLAPEEMLDFYLIHGILHLVGYDHEGPADEAALMEAKTREIWRTMGYPELD